MSRLIILFLLFGCNKSQDQNQLIEHESAFKLYCESVRAYFMDRCENKEVICYVANRSMSCFKK